MKRNINQTSFENKQTKKKLTLIKAFALVNKPNVVWRLDSGPNGTISLSFSRQLRKCARLKCKNF